jgi:hypothetical protein
MSHVLCNTGTGELQKTHFDKVPLYAIYCHTKGKDFNYKRKLKCAIKTVKYILINETYTVLKLKPTHLCTE